MARRPRRTLKLSFPTNTSKEAEEARLLNRVRQGKAKLQDLPPGLRERFLARLSRNERRSSGTP